MREAGGPQAVEPLCEQPRRAFHDRAADIRRIRRDGLKVEAPAELADAIAAEQQCLTHIAMLRCICGMFQRDAGSRGSHCILSGDGTEIHPALIDPATGRPCRFRPENEALRGMILTARYNAGSPELFDLSDTPVRPMPDRQAAFEPAWKEFREGKIYGQ